MTRCKDRHLDEASGARCPVRPAIALACRCPAGALSWWCAPLARTGQWLSRRSCQVPQALRQAYNLRQRAKRAAELHARQGEGPAL